MPELYAVLMPHVFMNILPIGAPDAVAGLYLLLLIALCVRLSVVNGQILRWIARSLLVAIALTVLLALGSSVYAFLLFPAVFWGCGWCWVW